jgi:hypothetical protein
MQRTYSTDRALCCKVSTATAKPDVPSSRQGNVQLLIQVNAASTGVALQAQPTNWSSTSTAAHPYVHNFEFVKL